MFLQHFSFYQNEKIKFSYRSAQKSTFRTFSYFSVKV